MSGLKLPTLPPAPMRPAKYPGQTPEERIKSLEQYSDTINNWAISLTRALMAWSKQVNDLYNFGSIKRL